LADEALTLDHFQVGEQGKIASLQADTDLKQRLAALGMRGGATVQVLRKASFGGPVHVRIGTTEVIMRLNEAKRIIAVPLGS
jgi:ferrous iron transport protein A